MSHPFSWLKWLTFLQWAIQNIDAQTVVLNGGGAAFGLPVYEKWWSLWSTIEPAAVIYKGIGSYFGKRWIRGEPLQNHEIGERIVFAGTNFPLTKQDYKEYPTLQMIPVIGGALVIVYNLPGAHNVRLSREALTDIFLGEIQKWNDVQLLAMNPHAILPDKEIKVLCRRDESGVTETLTKGLTSFREEWANGPGIFRNPDLITPEGPSRNWPENSTSYYPYTDVGMSSMILSIPYSLGYVSVAEALDWGLQIASLENKHGETITPDMVEEGVNIAMDYNAKDLGKKMVADLIDTPQHKAYPLATFTYLLVNMTTTPGITCRQMMYFQKMVRWVLTSEDAKILARDMQMVPLIPELVRLIEKEVLEKMTCMGEKVIDLIAEEDRPKGLTATKITVIVLLTLAGSIVLFVFGWQYNIRLNVGARKWLIGGEEVTMGSDLPTLESHTSQTTGSKATYHSSQASGSHGGSESQHSVGSKAAKPEKPYMWPLYGLRAGFCRGDSILLFECRSKRPPFNYRYSTCKRILYLHKQLSIQDNILPLLGLLRDNEGKLFHMYKSNAKSSLHHILSACPYELNEEIKFTLASDVCKAMAFLHKNNVKHGMLDTWNCLMDSNWSLRVANWTQTSIAEEEGDQDVLTLSKDDVIKVQNITEMKRCLFRHPDYWTGMIGQGRDVLKTHDLYSYAMVLVEIFSRKLPYSDKIESFGGINVLFKALCNDHKLPSLSDDLPQHIRNLADQLLKNLMQVSFDAVLVVLEMSKTSKKGYGVVDTLMKAMEEYMGKLEEKVQLRTNEMKQTTTKMDELVRTILPKEVADKLQSGQSVEPKVYDPISIFYSDIVDLSKMSSNSTPVEMLNFMNAFYVLFDKVSEIFDVCKIQTMGNSYMCVSGVPKRNGDRHAAEVARLALTLLKAVKKFKIAHRPRMLLKVRFGIHSGSIVAGLVGLKTPRLFET